VLFLGLKPQAVLHMMTAPSMMMPKSMAPIQLAASFGLASLEAR
jgi:hypothetical protein